MQSSFQYTGSIHIDRSSPMIIPSFFIIKILNEIKYPWLEKQQAGIVLFTPKPIFLLQTTLSLSRFFSIFFATFFFFIILHHLHPSFSFQSLVPLDFYSCLAPFYFSPFPATMREVAPPGWEKIVCNLWQVSCASRFCNMNASRWHRFRTVSSKSNFPFQFVITPAYIRRHWNQQFCEWKWWNIRLSRKKWSNGIKLNVYRK